jgi:hypothetical protein
MISRPTHQVSGGALAETLRLCKSGQLFERFKRKVILSALSFSEFLVKTFFKLFLCKNVAKSMSRYGAMAIASTSGTEDSTSNQGCQMICSQTKNSNLGKFWRALDWKMLIYFLAFGIFNGHFGIFYDYLVHIVFIWYILCSFGTYCVHLVHILCSFGTYILCSFGKYCVHLVHFIPVLVSCTKTNLAAPGSI